MKLAQQLGEEDPIIVPAWDGLLHELLVAILHPSSVDKEARLVCRSFHDAYNANFHHFRRATLHPPPLAPVEPRLPRPPPWAAVLRLKPAFTCLMKIDDAQSLELGRLVAMLQLWPIAAPLELDLSHNYYLSVQGVEALMLALKYPGCARGGLQVLDMSGSDVFEKPSAVQHLAMLVRASPQLAALRELRLASCGLEKGRAAALCDALQGATHVRSLTLLDLSRNYMGRPGVRALAVCLRNAPHLRSLQQLLLEYTHGGPTAVGQLAGAVAGAQLPLTALDIRGSDYGDKGAAAWAAVLPAAACLAGLEVLELGDSEVTLAGITQLVGALQAATHLTRLRRLGLPPDEFYCGGDVAECAARFVHMLQHSPHLAASLQEMDLRFCSLATGAMAAGCGAFLANGACLPRLRRLDLGRLGNLPLAEGVRHVCTALIAGTHLTGLQQLDLDMGGWGDHGQGRAASQELEAALSAATQLSSLRSLPFALRCSPERIAGLLHAAPHLRGLTTLVLQCGEALAGWAPLLFSLQLLPALRSLELHDITNRGCEANMLQLLAVLALAPCTPSLEELSFRGVPMETVARLGEALQACTGLCGLRRLHLRLQHGKDLGEGDAPLLQFGAALGACRHLAGLRELRVAGASARTTRAVITLQQALWEALTRGGHISAVRVNVLNRATRMRGLMA